MSALSFNQHVSEWVATGLNVNTVPQYRLTISLNWLDANRVSRSAGPVVILFPNFIATLTAPERQFFEDELREVIVKIARLRTGADL